MKKFEPNKYLVKFLLNNGFQLIENNNHFANDMCGVVINEEYIEIADNDGNTSYSKDLNIYYLVGYLTWYNFIPKNYVK